MRAAVFGFAMMVGVSSASACPDNEHEECKAFICFCVTNWIPPLPSPEGGVRVAAPGQPIPPPKLPDVPVLSGPLNLPLPFQGQVQRLCEAAASRAAKQLGEATVTTCKTAAGDIVDAVQNFGEATFATITKAGGDVVTTTWKAVGDVSATYAKAWQDTNEQAKRSFEDVVDAGKAVGHFAENQINSELGNFKAFEKRFKNGDILGAMWGAATDPLKSGEDNFFKATQESTIISAAAASAAATYGGPAGAAAYAAWSTYRTTGNAEMALRAGALAALTTQLGSATANMPSGTEGEIIRKAAAAGAAGGIAVAAAGGDEQAITEGFLKSAGAVLIQDGSAKIKTYSPEANNALEVARCISAQNVDCVSNTTWARDARGRILPHMKLKLDPKDRVGQWSKIANSAEAARTVFVTNVSKLPGSNIIPLYNNKFVLTYSFGATERIPNNTPAVVLTYVGDNPGFQSSVTYSDASGREDQSPIDIGRARAAAVTCPAPVVCPARAVCPAPPKPTPPPPTPSTSNTVIIYYIKTGDGDRVTKALRKNSIKFKTNEYHSPGHENTLTNALVCGPNTDVRDVKRVAFALIDAGVDIKYIGSNSFIAPSSIQILNKRSDFYTLSYRNVSRRQINELSKCPSAFHNG